MKSTFIILAVIGLGVGAYVMTKDTSPDAMVTTSNEVVATTNSGNTNAATTQTNQQATPQAAAQESSATAIKVGTYSLITNESSIVWEAGKPQISGYTHTGTIGLSSGAFVVADKAFSGKFTINMNDIKVTSLGGGKVGKESALETHLKKADFFDSETYPTGTFAIDSLTQTATANTYTVKGKLTLKGITKPVEFPVVISQSANGKVVATGPVTIDRTLWGITYGSGSFFSNLADNAIDNNIKLRLTLTAK